MLEAEELAFSQDKLIERELMNEDSSEDKQDKFGEVGFDEDTLKDIDNG